MRISLFLILVFSFSIQASPPPCTVWQVKVRTHPVKKYKREDGTEYSKTTREEHCRDKFPTVTHWQDRFLNITPNGWPDPKEKFKDWNQTEKETILRALSIQPRVLRELTAKLVRGVISNLSKNPGTTAKSIDTIALYDEFFYSTNQNRILSHELSHLYLHRLDPEKLSALVEELGWRHNKISRELVRLKDSPKLKQDSDQSITEDIANHLEDFLYDETGLRKKFPKRYELIKGLVPSDFKLEKQ
jgi:DNA-directed RNA polymerase subunit F